LHLGLRGRAAGGEVEASCELKGPEAAQESL